MKPLSPPVSNNLAPPRRFRLHPDGGGLALGILWPDGTVVTFTWPGQHVTLYPTLLRFNELRGVEGQARDIEWLDTYEPGHKVRPAEPPQVIEHFINERGAEAYAAIDALSPASGGMAEDIKDIIRQACRDTRDALLRAQGVL